jgi:hypothetical protein
LDETDGLAMDERQWPGLEVGEFMPTEERLKPRRLMALLREDVGARAKRLRQLESAIREAVNVAATTLNAAIQADLARQNVVLQRTIRTLTGAAIMLGGLTLLFALPDAISAWGKMLAGWFSP